MRGQVWPLVELIYSAMDDARQWSVFLERFAALTGGSLTSLHGQDLSGDRGEIAWAAHFAPAFQRTYVEHYASRNVYMTQNKHLIGQPGRVVTGEMVCPAADVLRSEYYEDWLRPQDLFHVAGGIILRDGAWTFNLSTLRSRRRGPYGESELALIRVLMPHLQRSLQVQRRLGDVNGLATASAAALDHLPLGVILTDRAGRVRLANAVARAILADRDGMTIQRGRLHALDRDTSAHLAALIDRAGRALDPGTDGPGGAMRVLRPSLRRPLSVLVAPLPARLRSSVAGAAAVLFVSDPDRIPETRPELLRRFYGLTVAESRLAASVADGKTVEEAATAAGVTNQTARAQLKSVFRKTDTNRQSDLVRLLMASPATVRQS